CFGRMTQTAAAGEALLSNFPLFLKNVVYPYPGKFRELDRWFVPASVPLRDWGRLDLAGKSLPFLVQSLAICDNVGLAFFAHGLLEHARRSRIAVACTGPSSDLLRTAGRLEAFPLWLAQRELAAFDHVFDIGELPEWGTVETAPLDLETTLLRRFGLEAPPVEAVRRPASRPRRICVFPLATAPIPSFPPGLTPAICPGVRDLCAAAILL